MQCKSKTFMEELRSVKRGIVVKTLGLMNYLIKTGDQVKKFHADPLMVANSDSSDKTLSDDWDTIPFEILSAVPQKKSDSASNHAENLLETMPAKYPQRERRPVKCFELIEFCM